METIKNLIGSRDKPLAAQPHDYHYEESGQGMEKGGEYGGGKENAPFATTPLQTPPKTLHSIGYGRLEEPTTSKATLSMSDLQKQIESVEQPASSSAYSTPMMHTRTQTVNDDQKYPPIVKRMEGEGREIGTIKSKNTNKEAKELVADEPFIKFESVYSGPTKTAYGHGFSEGYKRAIADLQGHAGKGVIEYPNPSVYKLLTEKKEDIAENQHGMASFTVSVGSAGKKTKSFFIRMMEKLGCASTDADHEQQDITMEKDPSHASKKYRAGAATEKGEERAV